MSKKALITGVTGQDGAYLSEFLLKKGYEVHGIKRRSRLFNTDRIDHLYQDPHADVRIHPPPRRYDRLLQPDPHHREGAARRDLQPRGPVTRGGVLRDPRVHRQLRRPRHPALAGGDPHPGLEKKTRFYQASTSELFGLVRETPQTENTPFYPRSPYAVAKLYGYWIMVNYREAYGVRLQRHPLQPRIADPGRDLRHPQDHPGPGPHRPGHAGLSLSRQSGLPSATGATPATTWRCSG